MINAKRYFNIVIKDFYVYVKWKESTKKLNDDGFIESLQIIGKKIQKSRKTKLLVNTIDLGVLIDEKLMKKILKTWIPYIKNVKKLAVIVNQAEPIKLMGISELLEAEIKIVQIEAQIFDNEKKAVNWLAK